MDRRLLYADNEDYDHSGPVHTLIESSLDVLEVMLALSCCY